MAYTLQDLQAEGIPRLLKDVETIDAWEEKRASILERWMDMIGEIPACEDVNIDFLSLEKEADHYRLHLKYESAFNDWVPAYLLIPKSIDNLTLENIETELFSSHSLGEKMPAVIAMHPTAAEGKDDISLATGRENRLYGLELVKRGYIVLAPDTITAGERVESADEPFQTASFYEKYPDWSAVAKMIVDHKQGISLLSKIAYVGKIGVIGHSLGGYNGYFLAGIDRRVKAVACSCGFAVFANDPEKERWGRRSWFTHMPKISDYIINGEVPFEFNEIAALVAPTPFFIWMGQKDNIFPNWEPAAAALGDIDSLYTFLGEESQFKFYIGNAGHDFPTDIRELAYDFLDEKLKEID